MRYWNNFGDQPSCFWNQGRSWAAYYLRSINGWFSCRDYAIRNIPSTGTRYRIKKIINISINSCWLLIYQKYDLLNNDHISSDTFSSCFAIKRKGSVTMKKIITYLNHVLWYRLFKEEVNIFFDIKKAKIPSLAKTKLNFFIRFPNSDMLKSRLVQQGMFPFGQICSNIYSGNYE